MSDLTAQRRAQHAFNQELRRAVDLALEALDSPLPQDVRETLGAEVEGSERRQRVSSRLAQAARAIEILCSAGEENCPVLDRYRLIRHLTASQIAILDHIQISDLRGIWSALRLGRTLIDNVLPFADHLSHEEQLKELHDRATSRREAQFEKKLKRLVEEEDEAAREKLHRRLDSSRFVQDFQHNLDRIDEEASIPFEQLQEATDLLLGCSEAELGFALRLGESKTLDELSQDGDLRIASERGAKFKRELKCLVGGLERQLKLQSESQVEEFRRTIEEDLEDQTLLVSSRGRPLLGRVIAANVYEYLLKRIPARYYTEADGRGSDRKFNKEALDLAAGLVNKSLAGTKALPKDLTSDQVTVTHRSRFSQQASGEDSTKSKASATSDLE